MPPARAGPEAQAVTGQRFRLRLRPPPVGPCRRAVPAGPASTRSRPVHWHHWQLKTPTRVTGSVEFPVSWRCTGTLSGIGSGNRRRRPAASGRVTGFSKCGARSARWSPSPSHNDRGVGRLVTVTMTVTELRSFSAESLPMARHPDGNDTEHKIYNFRQMF